MLDTQTRISNLHFLRTKYKHQTYAMGSYHSIADFRGKLRLNFETFKFLHSKEDSQRAKPVNHLLSSKSPSLNYK